MFISLKHMRVCTCMHKHGLLTLRGVTLSPQDPFTSVSQGSSVSSFSFYLFHPTLVPVQLPNSKDFSNAQEKL